MHTGPHICKVSVGQSIYGMQSHFTLKHLMPQKGNEADLFTIIRHVYIQDGNGHKRENI